MSEPSLLEAQLQEEQVVAFLGQHPDFFLRHKALLDQLQIPHPIKGAVSLVELHQERQRERIETQEQELRELMETASRNERIFRVYADVYPELFACTTLRQLWNGVPVLPCRATLVYEGGELKRIEEGRRLTGTPQTTAGTPITATTALMRFYAGLSERMDICSEVREIEIAYTLSNALGGPISLIPVWHITTDTEIYELNTLDGSLAAAGAEETERSEL